MTSQMCCEVGVVVPVLFWCHPLLISQVPPDLHQGSRGASQSEVSPKMANTIILVIQSCCTQSLVTDFPWAIHSLIHKSSMVGCLPPSLHVISGPAWGSHSTLSCHPWERTSLLGLLSCQHTVCISCLPVDEVLQQPTKGRVCQLLKFL